MPELQTSGEIGWRIGGGGWLHDKMKRIRRGQEGRGVGGRERNNVDKRRRLMSVSSNRREKRGDIFLTDNLLYLCQQTMTTDVINEMACGGAERTFHAVSGEMTGGPALWNITHMSFWNNVISRAASFPCCWAQGFKDWDFRNPRLTPEPWRLMLKLVRCEFNSILLLRNYLTFNEPSVCAFKSAGLMKLDSTKDVLQKRKDVMSQWGS